MSSEFSDLEESDLIEPTEKENPQTIDSNIELSESDSPVSSTDSTPAKSITKSSAATLSETERGRVRRLTEYFSSSDSDTTGQHPPTTRRRKRSSEHQELPLGGEKELRRKMVTQALADEAVAFWQACVELMKTCLDEAQQALDQNIPRAVLLGHAAEMEACDSSLQEAWEDVNSFLQDTAVVLQKKELLLTKTKTKARCSKVLAQIIALTEIASPSPATGPLRLINSTSFGDLELPSFDGDYTLFDYFEGYFRGLINNGNLDDGGKKAFLLKQLKGEAKDFIGVDGLASKSYEDIWTELKGRYGKPWRITRAAVKKFMDIEDPTDCPKDISRYWNNINESCKTVERLKLTATSVILNAALLKLPVDFRAKMDDKIRPLSSEYILTRAIVAEPFNDVIAGELEKPNKRLATVGFNTIPSAATSKNYPQYQYPQQQLHYPQYHQYPQQQQQQQFQYPQHYQYQQSYPHHPVTSVVQPQHPQLNPGEIGPPLD